MSPSDLGRQRNDAQVERLIANENIRPGSQVPFSWSADGQSLVIREYRPETFADIGVFSMEGDSTIDWLFESTNNEDYPDVSPSGRWMAYTTDESGQEEVFVTPFPNVGSPRLQISQNGGLAPQWGPDDRELFFQTRDGSIMLAEIVTEPTLSAGISVLMFSEPYWIADIPYPPRAFDISSDGQRLLMIKQDVATDAEAGPRDIKIVLNWTEDLKRLVPTN